MVKSITIKNIQNLNITSIQHLDDDAGYIEPLNSISFNNSIFSVYNCSFNHNFEDEIIVTLPNGDDYEVTSYKKIKSFKAYYNNSSNLFFIEAPNKVANAFITKLHTDLGITINNFTFNFLEIIQRRNTTKLFNFKVEDVNIDNKTFSGTDVENNNEVFTALRENRGTYMLVSMDVANIQRSIGFSQRGVIVIQNKLTVSPTVPYPYFQCAYDILLAIKAI